MLTAKKVNEIMIGVIKTVKSIIIMIIVISVEVLMSMRIKRNSLIIVNKFNIFCIILIEDSV